MNILFVCTGNTCRSPMAEALMEKMAKEKELNVNVKSAGIFALEGQQVSKGAIEALKLEGINIDSYRAKIINRQLLEKADLILSMSVSHKAELLSKYDFIKGKIYTLKEYAYSKEENIEDPYGGDMHLYNKVKKEIKDALKEVIKQLEKDN
ncbi:low molecular weight protein arginine phosphatase [Schnuerera sp. xch1]|uniref:low molecular weight protein arginine phosphatase n=1 Tax=Schnuerera sp. xch1 TaxID=2874283 RepID=UPI001CBC7D86|nr:low molecular weight protein arginine phosphatase [Schnuerera sp. xch1]MBZ2174934.1 low molecular weight protein arginine phosphatase [Schnuerera sp. xch1]